MTQDPTSREKDKLFASQAEIAACRGKTGVAILLNKLTSVFAVKQIEAGAKTITLHLKMEKIQEFYPVSKASLSAYMDKLNEWGFVSSAKYGRELILHYDVIEKVKEKPPERPKRVRPPNSGRKKKSSEIETKSSENETSQSSEIETFDDKSASEAASASNVQSFNQSSEIETFSPQTAREAGLWTIVQTLETNVQTLKQKVQTLETNVQTLKLSQVAEAAPEATREDKIDSYRESKSITEIQESNTHVALASCDDPLSLIQSLISSMGDATQQSPEHVAATLISTLQRLYPALQPVPIAPVTTRKSNTVQQNGHNTNKRISDLPLLTLQGEHYFDLYKKTRGGAIARNKSNIEGANSFGETGLDDALFTAIITAIKSDPFLKSKNVRWDLKWAFEKMDGFADIAQKAIDKRNGKPDATGRASEEERKRRQEEAAKDLPAKLAARRAELEQKGHVNGTTSITRVSPTGSPGANGTSGRSFAALGNRSIVV